MKNHIIILLTGFALTMSIISCTQNTRAKYFGSTENVTLNKNEVFVGATWKEANLWIATVDTVTGIGYFREHSSLGFVEGGVVFSPSK